MYGHLMWRFFLANINMLDISIANAIVPMPQEYV